MSIKDESKYGEHGIRLSRAILAGKLSHAYIIEGDRLSGKADFAIDLAKAALCKEKPGEGCEECSICRRINSGNYEDMYRVAAEDGSLKDADISALQANLFNIPSAEGRTNVAIIDGAEAMTVRAQNRFLKTLEEPPAASLIILLSDNADMLLPTIRSRCNTIRLNSMDAEASELAEYTEKAEKLMQLAVEGEFFFELKEALDSIKTRKEAETLLDATERLLRDYMLKDSSKLMDRRHAFDSVKYLEEARKDLAYNVNHKYALRNLFLKIGG